MKILLFKNKFRKSNKRYEDKIKKAIIQNNGSIVENIMDAEVVLSLGGDGTMLSAVRKVVLSHANIPVMGINLGGLGFLTAFSHEETEKAIENLLKDKFRIEKRMLLCAIVNKEKYPALNDITINMGQDIRALEIEVFIDSHPVMNFLGDGIVVSTPTGSTAYALSCGGPIITPDTENILLTPISPHSLSARPLVVSDKRIIELAIGKKGEVGIVGIDGQIRFSIKKPERVVIKKSPYMINIIMPTDVSYFDILKRKMKWGGI